MKPQILILRAAGTNCELETAWAFELAGATPHIHHINEMIEKKDAIKRYQAVVIPGGFSYGDDISSGKVFANQINLYLKDTLQDILDREGLILGICNGFQVLIKTGFLNNDQVTLTHNASGRYLDAWVEIKCDADTCRFLNSGDSFYLPIAHAEGRFQVRDEATLSRLKDQLILKYIDRNPNGSEGHVAGMTNATGQILGLMPHPERHLLFEHHPHWTRLKKPENSSGDGLQIFQNMVTYLKSI